MAPTSLSQFQLTLPQFLRDIQDVAILVGAPFSSPRTQQALAVYSDSFLDSAIIWRITDRKEKQLCYRFYERHRRDCISVALKAGLLQPTDSMTRLVTSWSALFGGESRQSCDFDSAIGLVKVWVTFRGLQPLADILSTPGVPASILRHEKRFRSLGLDRVRHTCVDFQRQSINLYFEVPEQISEETAAAFSGLAGSEPPNPATYNEMETYLSKRGYPFGVTMPYVGDNIERVCFYAMGLSLENLPRVDDNIKTFFTKVPCHDKDPFNVVAWSFSRSGTYVKVDRSYRGEMLSAVRGEGRDNID